MRHLATGTIIAKKMIHLEVKPAIKKQMHCVNFFGTNDFAWIEEFSIKDYEQFKDTFIRNKQNKLMLKAIQEIEMYHYLKSR